MSRAVSASIRSSRRCAEEWEVKVAGGRKFLIKVYESFGQFQFSLYDGEGWRETTTRYDALVDARMDAWSKVSMEHEVHKIERVVA